MARLTILEYPDPRLHEVSVPVTRFDADLHQLLEDMFETMTAANGIGLAAPQVDRRIRVFVIDLALQEGQTAQRYEFINPRITAAAGKASFEEGCLSVPGVGESVTRKGNVTVSYQDRHGKEQRLDANDLLAVAIQHENDHLDGMLFVDRLPAFKRLFVKKKLSRRVTM
jgi:peptide deformylase